MFLLIFFFFFFSSRRRHTRFDCDWSSDVCSSDLVRGQVEGKWRDDQISTRLRAKATEMVGKLERGGTLAEEAAAIGSKVETATGFRRDASPPGVPSGLITAAFRTAKDGVGQTSGAGGTEWVVFRVTDISIPPVEAASDEVKKLKDTLQRGL